MALRAHPITGEPILFAPGRASRPRAFQQDDDARCPFCPGHESDTPPTIASAGEPWRVRVFPNKYPPIDGAEVIVESPDHDETFGSIAHADEVMRTYAARYRAHGDRAYTAIFKNQGARAGASIPHVHSQVMPLPFTPPRIARESEAFATRARCALCSRVGPTIAETDSFLWVAPDASSLPYQQWLVPKRHVCEISAWTAAELSEAADLLRRASRAMLRLTDAYNWMFLNFPRSPAAHSYVELFPRLATIAGFELGTGTFVEIIEPVAAAERLRSE